MSDALDEEEPFDWSAVNAGVQDPQAALEHLLPYLEHQLRSNRPEEEIWQELVAAGIPSGDIRIHIPACRAAATSTMTVSRAQPSVPKSLPSRR